MPGWLSPTILNKVNSMLRAEADLQGVTLSRHACLSINKYMHHSDGLEQQGRDSEVLHYVTDSKPLPHTASP